MFLNPEIIHPLFLIIVCVISILNDNQPLWYLVSASIGMGVLKLLSMFNVGEVLKLRVSADKSCKEEVAKLRMTIIKMHTSFGLILEYMDNPDNLEATKANLKIQLDGLDEIIQKINSENET